MPARFEVHQSDDDSWWFNLVAANGEEIARSQQYASRRSAQRGIASVKSNAEDAEIVFHVDDDADDMVVADDDGDDAPTTDNTDETASFSGVVLQPEDAPITYQRHVARTLARQALFAPAGTHRHR